MQMKLSIIGLFTLLIFSCKKDKKADNTLVNSGNDPNFTIVQNTDPELINFNKKVNVFGIDIYAVSQVDDNRLLHAANIMAQYLDNNEDGVVDNQLVLDKMLENKAFVIMWKTESDFPSEFPVGRMGQDLGNDETIPAWHTNGHVGQFDATLEEIWHIITASGYSKAYPNVFGEYAGTELTNAMDVARGGYFETIPNPYPANAWYSYDDETCDYNCMAAEYIYWSMSSILGAQENRLNEINQEWKLNTKTLVENTDAAIYQLLTNPMYKLPKVLPDGTYKH